jgi:tetrahydromethanopterin S-methyltransferase subunit G
MDRDTEAAIETLTKIVQDGFANINKRFTSIETDMEKGFGALAEDIASIKEAMVTKEELKPIEDRLSGVESKLAGINRRLDAEVIQRQDLKIPKRVSDLEIETFGASRHPAHIPLP